MRNITFTGIRVHNLKNVSVSIPHGKLIVVTGVSGSGKSSLALDTLYAEGQRRFMESLSAYVRQFMERMARPQVDEVSGILPAIAIESKNSIVNARSTVGTQTEVNDYIRLLFARIGKTYCTTCGREVAKDTAESVAAQLVATFPEQDIVIMFSLSIAKQTLRYLQTVLKELTKQGFRRIRFGRTLYRINDEAILEVATAAECIDVVVDRMVVKKTTMKRLVDSLETAFRYGKGSIAVSVFSEDAVGQDMQFSEHFHCAMCDLSYREPTPHLFSFNSPMGACGTCQGFGRVISINDGLVVPDEEKSLADGAIAPWATKAGQWEFTQMREYCRKKKIPLTKPFRSLKEEHRHALLRGTDDFFGVDGFFKYLEKKAYKVHVRVFLSRYRQYVSCPDCRGNRLKNEALAVQVGGKNIADICGMSIDQLVSFFNQSLVLTQYEKKVASTVLDEIKNRIRFLKEVGLGYITLDRLSRTLSGGESQRISLASALGTSLVDTLYVLDEPSIGLHARDNAMLMRILQALKKLGNTVIVIEHDRAMIEEADMVIDLGPYAGRYGGEIIHAGTVSGLKKNEASLTARYLRGQETIMMGKKYIRPERKLLRTVPRSKEIHIIEATEHNLQKINVSFPLDRFVVVTGVSGSGKSTLIHDILHHSFLRFRGRSVSAVGAVKAVRGLEQIADIVYVDQKPIGRTPRSNPVTFIDAYSAIRNVFAKTRGARLRKMTARHFSFNVDGGRCDMCKGAGKVKVEMHFLADVFVECEACNGTRFKQEVREVLYKGKDIDEVLSLTIDEAIEFFADEKAVCGKLDVVSSVGLGYLTLGQPATTLSAGEAQRLKLAGELLDIKRKNVLYLFDEPTVGLHYHDISFLMKAIEQLLLRGNSVLMIEHNIDVISCADYVIDLGPEGGDEGGRLLFAGPPAQLAKKKHSYTGTFLRQHMDAQSVLKERKKKSEMR